MALIGEITGSGGLTASGSVFISGSLQLSQETGDPTILENMGGAIYIKEDSAGANKFYFKNSGATVSELGGLGSENTWSETQTFSEVTGTSGFLVADDKKIYFGTGKDASFEYDENGTDTLLYAGASMRISDDTKIEFGTGGDASIEYDENGTDELRFAGAAVTFEQAVTFDANMTLGNAATDTVEVQGVLTASADVIVKDDIKLYFGTGKDASFEYDEDGNDVLLYAGANLRIDDDTTLQFGAGGDATIEYDEDGTDELRFAGAAVTFEQAVTFDGNMVLGNAATDTVEVQGVLTASADIIVKDDLKLYFGTGKDVSIEYDEDGDDVLAIAGNPVLISSQLTASAGIAISGSVHFGASLVNAGADTDKFLCVDTEGELRFRTGAEVASDAGAVAADANITFSGKLTASNGLVIATSNDGLMMADGIPIYVGTGGDLSIFHNGTDSIIQNGTGDLNILSTVNSAQAIFIEADGGTDETIVIHADQGTGEGNGNASIELVSDAGGICFTATGLTGVMTNGNSDAAIQAHAAAGGIGVRSTANLAGAIQIETDGGTDETIVIHSDQGSGEGNANASIELVSDVGGICFTATGLTGVMTNGNSDAAIQAHAAAGGIGLRSTANLEGCIQIEADGGANETISVHSDQGTGVNAAGGTTDASINLISDVGGIGLYSAINAVNAITIEANGGTSENIRIHSNQGTSATEGAASIQLLSDAGGINIKSGLDAVNAILLTADGGTSETIKLHADQGTAATSIHLLSDAGGITLDGTGVHIPNHITASSGISISGSVQFGSSLANAGADTDKFLCVNTDGELKFRTGAELASDTGAVAADANITFSGKLTASNGLVIATSDDGLMMADGIPIYVGAGGDLSIFHNGTDTILSNKTGDLKILSTVNSADAIFIEVDGGTSETIMIHSDQGTAAAAATETDASIQLHSDAGGIGLHSGLNADNAIRIEANGGANETIVIHSNQGTGEDHANSSILLLSDVGGVGLTATGLTGVMTDGNSDAAVQLTALAGGIGLRSTANLAAAIQIEADGGTDETIVIHSDQGTGEGNANASIELVSDVGGICFTATGLTGVMTDTNSDAAIQAHAAAGGIGLRTTSNLAGAIQIEADGGTAETIVIHSDQGTGRWALGTDGSSIRVVSDVGGVSIDAPALNHVHAFTTDALTNAFATDGDTCGTIIKYSPGADDTLTVGQLYFFHTDGTWNQCDADAVATGGKQLLGVGLGNARTVGVLIKGFVRIPNTEILNVPGSNASPGLPVYISTTAGHLDFTAPSGNGDIVRIVGYAIQDDTDVLIYFDPDPTYVEVSA